MSPRRSPTPPSTRDALEAVFERWRRRDRAPGVAWGLVRDGELVESGGIGRLGLDDATPPDADSVFRIASMTKSFTAAALMTLVAADRVRLDDPVAAHVPELASWRGPTTDGPPLTVRHLVSMESGLPTDDAWADRHLDLSDAEMDTLIQAGAAFAWTPGVAFEYSNLGWGLVGRVIERVAGRRPQDLVSGALLEPLGMTSTTWVRPDAGRIASPFGVVVDGEPVPETPALGDGTIAPMGGLWTTVRDLARWVGFLTDAFPPRDDADDGPLPRWARREMHQLRRFDGLQRSRPDPAGPSRLAATGYGIGLTVRVDERLGVSVGHSGGLPGYGSHMRWLPAHGVGVIGLSNVTYGSMHAACLEALELLADRNDLGPARGGAASPALDDAAARAATLLSGWSDEAADDLFADNVGPDEPYERRRATAGALVSRSGELRVESLEAETPLRGSFTTAGGSASVELGLNHESRVQWLDVEDRLRPSDAPIAAQPVDDAVGTAYVVVRPVGDLAEAFDRWQGEVLDRLGGARPLVASAHATLKAFGSPASPLPADEHARLVDEVTAWAADCPPIDLRADGLIVLGDADEHVPVVRLARTDSLVRAQADLWRRSETARLPAGYSDAIGLDGWIPHLSLAYLHDVDPAARQLLTAWLATIDPDESACVARSAELVAYDSDGEHRLGTFPLAGSPAGP